MKLDVTLGDLTKIGKSQKFTLSVDVEGGRLVLLRRQRDSQEDWTTFTHDRSEPGSHLGGVGGAAPGPQADVTGFHPLVRQLIKSQRVQNKLGVVFEKEKDRTQRKDFIFVSARVSSNLSSAPGGCRSPHGMGGEGTQDAVVSSLWEGVDLTGQRVCILRDLDVHSVNMY